MSRTAAVAVNPLDPVRAATETTGATFQINSTKLYVYVVTLSINDNIKILENLMDVYWDKYRSEITTQLRNSITWLIQHLRIFIGCLFFRSKRVAMML